MGIFNISPYSDDMRNMVVCVAFIYQFALMYIKFGMLLRMGEVKQAKQKKIVFALVLAGLAFSGDIYKFLLADTASMHKALPLVASVPGVIITISLWAYFVKMLHFKPLHALEIVVYTYLYFQTITGVTRVIGAIFFVQDPNQMNYAVCLAMYGVNFMVSIAFYSLMYRILDERPRFLIIKGMGEEATNKNVWFPLFQLCFIFICAACIMLFIPQTVPGSFLSLCMLVLFSAFCISLNSNRYAKAEIREKDRQMESLLSSINQFSAIKHDFYNILHTYNGYFELGDLEACKRYHKSLVEITTRAGDLLDLSRRAVEHPAWVSLLLNKHEQAERIKVSMGVYLECPLSHLPMEDIDICRVIACLLDNGIEAAAESEQRRVTFKIAHEQDMQNKIITITNSSSKPIELSEVFALGFTSKKGHQGAGISNAIKIMDKYPHCGLEIRNIGSEVAASINLSCSQ